ncbi:MAG: helix-turn-helix domain-containing protein, partial [Rhodococcus sp. (in: high G+C Gram-positive bacteria)]|uniref:winged helix-turn-helix domain-containing protein n=1 Tax=Rhodococcus sp. TaxID=1831 RepID=UPI003BB4F99B
MRNVAPSLLPIFRSQGQAEILTWLTQNPTAEATITDLARIADVPIATAHREISRFEQAGLVTIRTHGRNRL